MRPFFRPDPAWQSRRKRVPQSPSDNNNRRGRGTAAASTTSSSPSQPNSAFRDEVGSSAEEGIETPMFYEQLPSGSSGSSEDVGDQPPQDESKETDIEQAAGGGENVAADDLTAAELEWMANQEAATPTVHTGVPAVAPAGDGDADGSRPSTPVAGNKSQKPPASPSEAAPLPTFAVIPPHEVENETIINSALAEAWFARRREHRMQQMLMYNPQQAAAAGAPMMDPRTGGFQHAPSGSPRQQQHHMVMANGNRAVLVGPVDVDSGSLVDNQNNSGGQPPTAQAMVLRNPFEDQPPQPHPHFMPAYDASDSMTVLSKPNSLASYPSATTSDMTPIASNVAFPQTINAGRYASSSYAASSSSAAYMHNLPDQNGHRTANLGGGVAGDNPHGDQHHGPSKGFWACCGSSGGDRNSCKGFLDVRTYHGKLAILLVTILVLAIATMVVSATISFQTNKTAKQQSSSVQGAGSVPTASPTVAPVAAGETIAPTVSPVTTPPTISSRPTQAPAAPSVSLPTPTISPTKAPTRSPTVQLTVPPTDRPSSAPTKAPTRKPTPPPTNPPTNPPTEAPTRSPTVEPTTAPPTKAPTARPTQSLEDYNLPRVTTIVGPEAGSFFGTSVALSRNGQVLAVGAPEHAERRGQVRVLAASTQQQDTWDTRAVLEGLNVDDTFGFDVALSQDGVILAVGASGGNGAVYTYVYNPGQNSYVPIGEPILGQDVSASFGHSVALSEDGGRLVAGAPYKSTSGLALNGEVRVYELLGGSWNQMGGGLDGEASVDWLGSSVDISGDGNMVIASAPFNRAKKGYVRTWAWDGQEWTQTGADITNTEQPAFSSDRFGHSIALSESDEGFPRVAIGIPWKTVSGKRDGGMTLVYQFENGEWEKLGSPITQDPAVAFMENGNAVDLDGGILSVGIPGFNNTGAVALYRLQGGEWQKRSQLIEGNDEGDDFGVSLSSRRDHATDGFALVVGALMDGNGGAGYVASYVKQD